MGVWHILARKFYVCAFFFNIIYTLTDAHFKNARNISDEQSRRSLG